MPDLVLPVAGTAVGGAHKRVTFKSGTRLLTLPRTGEVVTHANLADDWITIKRSGKYPRLRRAGHQLHTMAMTVVFELADGTSVEPGIAGLINMAKGTEPIAVAYSGFETGLWRITTLSFQSTKRRPDNQIIRAEVSITLTQDLEAPPPATPAVGAGTPTRPAPARPGTNPTPKPAARRYTVRRGDTLSGIAARVYGKASRWPEIAKANHIRDPRSLRVGQVLIIP
jgi:nucleoid-associated protein YgaU